jgi:hypothetical protein
VFYFTVSYRGSISEFDSRLAALFSVEITIDRRLWANMLETVAAQGLLACIFFVNETQNKRHDAGRVFYFYILPLWLREIGTIPPIDFPALTA